MPIEGGESAMCGISLKPGAKLVMAAFADRGVLHPSSCTPHAFLPSPEGDAMLADAEESYGGAGPPPAPADPTEAPAPPAATAPAAGLALPVALGGVLMLVLLLFGGIALMARRRG